MRPRITLTLWIAETVLLSVAEEAERHVPNETGGVLLGHRTGNEVVVVAAIDAGPAAVRWRSGFKPDADFQEAEIERIFRSSDGAVTYLGDWHSHPTAPAVPSKPDRRTLRRIATDPDAQCPMPTMLILEQDEFELWSAAGWIGYLGRLGRWGRMTVSLMRIRTFASLR
jgi:integrative and conjugative element protein (TIGR02256 family)